MDGALPWLLLVVYGGAFWWLSPSADDAGGFYGGRDQESRSPGPLLLFASVFISWIFAKSVTNAANLSASFGLPGAVAYGAWWLSIPVAGLVIVWLRRRNGARSLPGWILGRYGRWAAYGFLVAILIRLYNEVWSNTAVVAAYFGPRGSAAFYAGALVFTAVTLFYTLKGGLRSSIFTDAVQAGVFGIFLLGVVFLGMPEGRADAARVLSSGEWTLRGGVDLLLVGLLQAFSYPFHDPVLTDRGFLSDRRTTVTAFLWAGALGFVAIVAFGTIGLPAFFGGMAVDDDAPRAVAASLGAGALLLVNVVMLTSAGSTLDSTFSALAKAVDVDVRELRGRGRPSARTGRLVMIGAAVVGNLPLFFGARILEATTISGTMVLGLAPAVALGAFVRAPPASFHLAFWTGLAVGVAQAAGLVPGALSLGDGRYADLLGANLWGLALATALFLVPVAARRLRGPVADGRGAGDRVHGSPEVPPTEASP